VPLATAHDHDAERAFGSTRSRLPCVAAEWTGAPDGAMIAILVVFAAALVAIALSYVL
jgi:hypothetical protein